MDKQFKAIAFDLDGTLIDTEPFYLMLDRAALRQHIGRELTQAEYDRHFLGFTSEAGFVNFLTELKGKPPTEEEVLQLTNEKRALSVSLGDSYIFQLFPGALEVLTWCRECGIPMAVVTNGKRTTIEQYRARYHLDKWQPMIDRLVTVLDVVEGKPAPDLYLKAAQLLGVEPSDLLVVEDTDQGVQSGQLAGAKVVRVNNSQPGEADYHFLHIEELIGYLPKFFAKK